MKMILGGGAPDERTRELLVPRPWYSLSLCGRVETGGVVYITGEPAPMIANRTIMVARRADVEKSF